jgi:hypothetical protein
VTFSDRFLWKRGDIKLSKCKTPATEEQKRRARRTLDEVVEYFDEHYQKKD